MESFQMPRSFRHVATPIALVLVVLPSAAMGQGVHHDNNPFAGKPVPTAPVNVARTILEHDNKDMALSDSQRAQLTRIRRTLDSADAPLLKRLDSLRPNWRPAGGLEDLSQEQRDELIAQRTAQVAVIDSLTPSYAKAREHVMALLRPEQQERAAKLEKEERKRTEEAARREFERRDVLERGSPRRRGDMRDGTGRAPLG
jgi:predicted phage gp36 major capsid-like protein